MASFREEILFENRKEAGIRLGKVLKGEELGGDPLILGVPRGGIEIAYYVARELGSEFSVVVSKKMGYPGNEEYAFGAVAEDGSMYLSDKTGMRLNREIVEKVREEKLKEIARRILTYRNGEPLPIMKGRTVVIADDGIATGATLIPIVEMCKRNGADKVIVAAPVAPSSSVRLFGHADKMVVLAKPEPFYAVGQFYKDFHAMDDQEIMLLLEK